MSERGEAAAETTGPEREPGRLAENIVHFGRALRAAGLPVGPATVVDAVRAVEATGLDRRADLYWALHALFVSRRDQRPVFDEVFRRFWRRRGLAPAISTAASDEPAAKERPAPGARRAGEALARAPQADPRRRELVVDARLTVSAEEVLRRRDFAQMSAAELAEARRRIAALRLPDDRVASRRDRPAAGPGHLDARAMLRASLRTGGALILPRFRERRTVRPPIVALLDISGSMSDYSRVILHFLHMLSRQRRVSSFVFGTRLTNVTRFLRARDPDEAMAACSDAVADWAGGTRIGAAIATFNRLWSRRVLGQNATVLLMTDGLERDGPEDLAAAVDRLHRSCRRLIWLNPLLRYDRFEARARGIRAMLPHVDAFRPVHSLDSMAALCRALGDDGAAADPRAWLKAG